MTQNQVYTGEIYQYLDIYEKRIYSYASHSHAVYYCVVWNKNPKSKHWLPSIDLGTLEPSIFIYNNECYSKKPKRIITGNRLTDREVKQAFHRAVNRYEEEIADLNACVFELRKRLYNYTFTQNLLDEVDTEVVKKAITEKVIEYENYMARLSPDKIRDVSFYDSDDPKLKEKLHEIFNYN